MNNQRSRIFAFRPLAFGAGCLLLITSAHAAVTSFVVDPTQSSLTLSGNVVLGAATVPLEAQDPNSLTTTYFGTIDTEIIGDTITILPASLVSANNSGDWEPGVGGGTGMAPANYGGTATYLVTANAAVRNLDLSLESDPIAIAGGMFAANSIQFGVPATSMAAADYNAGFFAGSGSEPLAGNTGYNAATAGSLEQQSNESVLTIDVNYTVNFEGDFTGMLNVAGQLVGKASTPLMLPSPGVVDGMLSFSIPTEAGKTYQILTAPDLTMFPFPNIFAAFSGDGTTKPVNVPIQSTGNQFVILFVN